MPDGSFQEDTTPLLRTMRGKGFAMVTMGWDQRLLMRHEDAAALVLAFLKGIPCDSSGIPKKLTEASAEISIKFVSEEALVQSHADLLVGTHSP